MTRFYEVYEVVLQTRSRNGQLCIHMKTVKIPLESMDKENFSSYKYVFSQSRVPKIVPKRFVKAAYGTFKIKIPDSP